MDSIKHHTRLVATASGAIIVLATLSGTAAASSDEPAASTCFGLTVTIRGTRSAEVIHGTPSDDVIAGGRGRDLIFGGGGNDTICGERGNDRLYGEDGDDSLDGGIGSGRFENPGGDNLDGGLGDDTIEGGEADDHDDLYLGTATGGVTVDLETGLATGPGIGNDHVSGIDHVYGTKFRDKIIGSEYVDAGLGNDVVLRGRVIRGQGGDDRMSTTLDAGGYINGGDGDDHGRNAWVQYGEDGDDVLIGGASADQLFGGDGDDVMRGLGSTDNLEGAKGNDDLRGGPGRDTVSYQREHHSGMVVDGRAGTAAAASGSDTIRGFYAITTTVYADVVSGMRYVDSSSGDDEVRGALYVTAGEGDDLLVSRRRGSELHGDSDDDVIRGRSGNDTLVGGTGDDEVSGRDGLDALSGDDGDDYLDGGALDDSGDGGSGTDTCVNIETAVACELADAVVR